MSYDTLKNFIKDVIEYKGGIAEEEKEGTLDVLLPKDLSLRLSCDEYTRLSLLSPEPSSELVTYGSPLLDKMITLTQDMGGLASISLEGIGLRSKGLRHLIDSRFNFLNAKRVRTLVDKKAVCSYLLINFRCSIISDEKREEIVTTIVDEHTLRSPLELIDIVSQSDFTEGESEASIERLPMDKVYEKANFVAVKIIEQKIKELESSNLRRLKRDIERLWEYYDSLKNEVLKKLKRGASTDEESKNYLSKINTMDLDFKRKKRDLIYKYSLKIKFDPINACRICIPKNVTEYEIQRKTLTKKINFFWDPFRREIEPLVCESCLEDTFNIYLCDKLHIICPRCYFKCEQCGRKICKKCFPERCPSCGKKYESRIIFYE